MKYNSVADIIGPVMVGPSSSHTAGAVRIGQIAREIYGEQPETAAITFYGSFAHTFRGHGTDVAVVAGLLGMSTFDRRIPEALKLALEVGMKVTIRTSDERVQHPNTARIQLNGKAGKLEIIGVSVGGGAVQIMNIDGYRVRLMGDVPSLLIMHQDTVGVVASITQMLGSEQINIAHMELSRKAKGKSALLTLEADGKISTELLLKILSLPYIQKVVQIQV